MINWRNKMIGVRALWHFDNRWQLISERLFCKNRGVSVYRLGDTEFLIDHEAGDHNGTRLCIISDIYTRFLPMMNLGDTVSVFDLGANGGGFPLMLHLQGKRFSRLVCVEMNPNTFCRLQYNITRNIQNNFSLIQAAVCGHRRQLNLRFGRGDISDTIYQDGNKPPHSSSEVVVEGRTFDDLFHSEFGEKTVDICKMDIEGAEYEVMSSLEQTCLEHCRFLLVELHAAPSEQQNQFAEKLEKIGFTDCAIGSNRVPGERLYRNERFA